MILKLVRNLDFQSAVKDMMGPSIGIFAWSVVLNLAILKTGLGAMNTLSMALVTYAGSAQLAALPLMFANDPIWIIVITTVVVNSRFIIYSASIAPHFRDQPFFKRCILGYLNGDICFTIFSKKYPEASASELLTKLSTKLSTKLDPHIYNYFLGASITNWIVWQLGLFVAVIFGTQLPPHWDIAFAGSLVLMCLIVPNVKSQKEVVIALISILTCVLTINFPYRLSILCTVLMAMASAYLMYQFETKPQNKVSTHDV